MKGSFRSLASYNYRVWAAGALVSYVGTWMQRVAQTWLVLTELTDNNVTAVGLLTALQFGPLLLLLPWAGLAADYFDRRKLLMTTQAIMGGLAFSLGLLAIFGFVQLWHVYVFAFLLGCVTAFDSPASHTFAADLVGENDLSNAVALNATAFNLARMVGPAVAGVVISTAGSGWAFLINAGSFAFVIAALLRLRVAELHHLDETSARRVGLAEGLRHLWGRPPFKAILLMLFLIGTFAHDVPLFISAMAAKVFRVGASEFGLLVSIMAVGSVAGAILSAVPARPDIRNLLVAAGVLATGFVLAAVAPSYWYFAAALIPVGAAAVAFTTLTSSVMQLEADPLMRGRVMALRTTIAVGGTPLGAPILGWVADSFGARWALAVAAAAAALAALIAARYRRTTSPPDHAGAGQRA